MTAEETRLRAALADAFPAPAAAPARLHSQLAARAAEAAAQRARRAVRRRQLRLGLACAFVCAVISVFATTWPRFTAARALRHMETIIHDARSAHLTMWAVAPDGSRAKTSEIWYQNGMWRMEAWHRVQVYKDGTLYTSDPLSKRVLFDHRPVSFRASGFSLTASLHAILDSDYRASIRDLGKEDVDGKTARQVSVQMSQSHERLVFFADPKTDMPFRVDVESQVRGRWECILTQEAHYNEALPARLFAAEFAPGSQFLDQAKEREKWRERLTPGIARREVAGGTVVVRDWQRSAAGDVFVLYTDDDPLVPMQPGQTPAEETRRFSTRLALTDEQGTRFVPHDGFYVYTPTFNGNSHLSPDDAPSLSFDGHPLKAEWWTPLTPPNPNAPPRRLALTCRVTTPPFALPLEEHTRALTFTLPEAPPACAVLPDYMPAMSTASQFAWEREILMGQARARAEEWKRSADGDPAKLEAALQQYRQFLALDDAAFQASGVTINRPEIWFAMYELLRDLGRRNEAHDALNKAAAQDVHRDSRWIETARTREGW